MDVKEVIEKRRSIRKYKRQPIDKQLVEDLLYYANLAPSAGNLQARDFIIVDDESIKEGLAEAAYNQEFIKESPIVVVFCANLQRIAPYGLRGINFYCLQDVAAAIQNFLLVATSEGLATCWVGAFDDERVAKILELPSHVKPVAIVPVGIGDEKPIKTERYDLKELIHYNKWRGKS